MCPFLQGTSLSLSNTTAPLPCQPGYFPSLDLNFLICKMEAEGWKTSTLGLSGLKLQTSPRAHWVSEKVNFWSTLGSCPGGGSLRNSCVYFMVSVR